VKKAVEGVLSDSRVERGWGSGILGTGEVQVGIYWPLNMGPDCRFGGFCLKLDCCSEVCTCRSVREFDLELDEVQSLFEYEMHRMITFLKCIDDQDVVSRQNLDAAPRLRKGTLTHMDIQIASVPKHWLLGITKGSRHL
jgi:hypothetical protein